MTSKTKLTIISIISVLAFFNATYLSYDWLFPSIDTASNLYFPVAWWVETGSSFCDINETLSCSTVLQHPLAQIFGIPFPVIAMVVYPLIFIIALLWYFSKIKSHFKALILMSFWWIMFNSYFIYQETVNIWAFCPLCLLCSLIIITIFILSLIEILKKKNV